MVGHSLIAFLKPWICWAWGSLGARPLVWISISTFLPFFLSMAWPSAPERLRGFNPALKSVFLLLLSSRSSPPLAKATEARLSDRATASSSTMVNFLDNFLHPFFVLFRSKRKLGIALRRSPYSGLRPPVCLPSSVIRHLLANEHDAPHSAGCHRAFRLFHT